MGAVALVLVACLTALAIFFHKREESEKNRARTSPARSARWSKTAEPEKDGGNNPVSEPEPEPEPVKIVS